MSSLLITAILAGLYCFWGYLREKREQEEEEWSLQEEVVPEKKEEVVTEKKEEEEPKEQEKEERMMNMGTRDLLMDTLTKIGCQYTIDESEENRICFTYQGEHFDGYASNESMMITIWDYWWTGFDLYDIDTLSRVKRVINDANIKAPVTTVYSIDEEDGKVGVHSCKRMLFIPQIPNIEDYLQATLAEFFQVHRYIKTRLEMIRVEEESNASG